MRKFIPSFVFACAILSSAQSISTIPPAAGDQAAIAKLQLDVFRSSVEDGREEIAHRKTAAREEALARLLFTEKANRFVELWGDFVHRLNDKQTVDAKLAKKLSKAFHELESSDGWPLRDQRK